MKGEDETLTASTIRNGVGRRKITWRKGFHRLFIVLSLIWVVYVLVVEPRQTSERRYRYAHVYKSYSETETQKEKEAREQLEKKNLEEAKLSYIYKVKMIREFPLVLLEIFLPPVFLYGLIRAVVFLARWLFRGFTS